MLWRIGDWATPREIAQALDRILGYTTVTTILVRLKDKGLTERQPRGIAFAYRPTRTRAQLTVERMQAAMADVPDRDEVLAGFVARLSRKEKETLRKALGT